MATKKLLTGTGQRRAAQGAAILGVIGALSLGLTSSVHAAPSNALDTTGAVTLKVSQEGKYVAAVCGLDILGGRCETDVRTGQSRTFTVNPRPGEQVSVRVVVDNGGSIETAVAANSRTLCFESGGSRAEPTVQQVTCR